MNSPSPFRSCSPVTENLLPVRVSCSTKGDGELSVRDGHLFAGSQLSVAATSASLSAG